MIKHLTARLAALLLPTLFVVEASAQTQPQPTRHEFLIRNFTTESKAVLPEARIVYGTYGTLNAAGDNAVLLPSHYMADMTGYAWLIGPGKALDTPPACS